MFIKGITDEDFINYRVPSMFVCAANCDFKCDKENGSKCCQNSQLARQETIDIDERYIIERYLGNPITKAVVFGGLEPFYTAGQTEIVNFVRLLRNNYGCDDDVVIYTGYYPEEIPEAINGLKCFKNIVVKFGRYIPDQDQKYDDVLGVNLASPNQYAVRLS